jgi:hypothetical protein
MTHHLAYNVEVEFDECMDCLDEVMDVLVYTRLALALKLDLTKELLPILSPVSSFDPFKTIGKY